MNLEITRNLELIKSPHSETREGAYTRLVDLFSDSKNLLTIEKKKLYLKELCGDNFLFYGIKEGISDCSVARSFSLLILGIIVKEDEDNEIEIESIVSPLLKYIEMESDFRGKDDKIGWIHSLAHLGDLLMFMATHKGISKKSIELISLSIIEKIISLKELPLNHGEDNRLALGFFFVLEELLGCNNAMLDSFNAGVKLEYPNQQNIVNIVRCLYIELITYGNNKALADQVKRILIPPESD